MQSHLLEEAAKVITTPQVLINIISRRVKQLAAGHRPLVENDGGRMGHSDTALTEVIHGKLTFEYVTKSDAEPIPATIVTVAAFTPKSIAA
jgi:DNA-directed RNA polymerase subunit omega